MTIYLNTVSGSRELEGSAIDKAITAMAIRLARLRTALNDSAEVSIDLTLMLPAGQHKLDFDGMRMTRFSSADGMLHIESVVPEKMFHSEQAERYVSAVVQDAVENAGEFFSERGLQFSTSHWQGLIQD